MKINKLVSQTIKPALFTPGTARMWNDPYISQQLLPVHLDRTLDLASRKPESIDRTINWILQESEVLKKDKLSILDLGCGPGLYAQRLTTLGHKVTGVDFSRYSLNYAEKRAAAEGLSINYQNQNYLELDLPEDNYDLVMMIYCDFGVLLPDEQQKLLQSIASVLKPGGLFSFDVLNEKDFDKKISPDSWDCAEKGFWRDHPYLSLSRSYAYEEEKVILTQHTVSDDRSTEIYRFWTQFFSHGKLRELLSKAGFEVIKFSEDVLPADNMWNGDNVTFTVARI